MRLPELSDGKVFAILAIGIAIFEFIFITHPEWWPQ